MTQRTFARFVVLTVALAALTAAYTMDRSHSRNQPAAMSRG
jgi:heme A synthase